jgi:SET domain-containing protein
MGKIEVKEIKENAKGLFAKQNIEKGSLIIVLKGKTFSNPTRTSIQIQDKHHIEDLVGGYMNHHCDPSAEIIIKNAVYALVVAKRYVADGEEITFDYETTESELSHPFECDCHGKLINGRGR